MDGVGAPTGEQAQDSDGRYKKRALWRLASGPGGEEGSGPVTALDCSAVSPTLSHLADHLWTALPRAGPDLLHPPADTLDEGGASCRWAGAAGREG